MANNKYKILKSIDDAEDLIKQVMEKPEGKRVIRGYQFPEGMRIVGKHIKFIGCKMHNVSFAAPNPVSENFIGKCYKCDLTGASFSEVRFHKKEGLWLVDCILDKVRELSLYNNYDDEYHWKYLSKAVPMRCPREGAYIAYKKALITDTPNRVVEAIVKLEIPADALRSSALGNKCRASKAKVISITGLKRSKKTNKFKQYKQAFSDHSPAFIYRVGETVEPVREFDTNRFEECSSGIHHFMTRKEAVEY